MKKILVSASKKYNILIGEKLLEKVGELSREHGLKGKICIVSDTNVAPLYLEKVKKSLEKSAFEVCEFIFPSGEAQKNTETFIKLLNFLAENHFTRTDSIFALGGGVTGDLAGFCAASYMRGINFVQLPTSLLAMVDSSVGGKTAIDLAAGKNLAGAFYQPEFVLIDIDALKTLPQEFICDAMAEIVKYAMISKGRLLSLLKENGSMGEIISECVTIKSNIVHSDEFESGVRRLLNFGHTVGHSVEALSHFNITHGKAVAIGMAIITRAWEKRGLCEKGTYLSLIELLEKFSLPVDCSFSPEELARTSGNDKKLEGSTLNLVVPACVGECSVEKIDIKELKNILKDGMSV